MKKRIMISVFAILGLLFSAPWVYAGSINGAEAGLIGKASGTFQYEGKTYVATPQALGQLRAYLSRDDIDLTQDQANRAASLMYSNVEGGVLDGYLMLAGGSEAAAGGSESASKQPQKQKKENAKKKKTEKAGKAEVTVEEAGSGLTVKPEKGSDSVFEAALPVKDTGFELTASCVALLFFLLCLPAAICAAWKLKLFAQKNES